MGDVVTLHAVDEVDGYGERLAADQLDRAFHIDEEAGAAATGTAGATRYQVATKTVTDGEIRCTGKVDLQSGASKTCNKLLAQLAGRPWQIMCPRCRTVNKSPA